jgi:hypothetical protein
MLNYFSEINHRHVANVLAGIQSLVAYSFNFSFLFFFLFHHVIAFISCDTLLFRGITKAFLLASLVK